jgi:DNA segregation ATPase FtsK/SpoIIIE-like protein
MPMTTDHRGVAFEYITDEDPPPPRVGPDGFMSREFTHWEWRENERRRVLRDPWTAARKERRHAALRVRSLQRFVDALTDTLVRLQVDLGRVSQAINGASRLDIRGRNRLATERERLESAIANQQSRLDEANADLREAHEKAHELLGDDWDRPDPAPVDEMPRVRFIDERSRR